MKPSAVLIVILLGAIGYVIFKDNLENTKLKETQDQARQEEEQTKRDQAAAQTTPAPKSGDTSWMWQGSGANPLSRGAYNRR